jgi:hypothetical protein
VHVGVVHVAAQPRDVESARVGVAVDVGRAELVLVVEQPVVHRPERALAAGGLGGLRGDGGPRVDVGEREVAPDVADVAAPGQQLADRRLGLPRPYPTTTASVIGEVSARARTSAPSGIPVLARANGGTTRKATHGRTDWSSHRRSRSPGVSDRGVCSVSAVGVDTPPRFPGRPPA